MRTPLILIAVLALTVAACGGGQVSADEVPGGPPALSVPSDDTAGGGAQTASNSSDTSTSGTKDDTSNSPDSTSTPSSSGSTGTTPSTGGSTAATPVPTATPQPNTTSNNQAPPAGSDDQKFQDFCQQNAGAC
jgi:hypothetical protein